MTLRHRIAEHLPSRATAAVHRVAVGIGLHHVITLERVVDELAEAVEENALLAAGLQRRVTELEQSLLPVLGVRSQRNERA